MLAVTGIERKESRQLIEEIGSVLEKGLKETIDRPNESSRIAQIAFAKRNYLYWQGKQYLAPKYNSRNRTVDWQQINTVDQQKIRFASTYNMIYGDGIKFISVVGEQSPAQKCVADDPEVTEYVRSAKDAQAALLFLHRFWDIRRRMKDVAFTIWTTGPAFGRTRAVADRYKYGEVELPNIQLRPEEVESEGFRCRACGTKAMALQCPNCGTPMDPASYEPALTMDLPYEGEPFRQPKAQVELDIFGVLNVQTAFKAKSLQDSEFLDFCEMISRASAKASHENEFDEDISLDRGEQSNSRREGVEAIQETQAPDAEDEGMTHMVMRLQRYLRPDVYHAFGPEVRKKLLINHPDGVMLTYLNDRLAKMESRRIDHEWAACRTGTGEYLNSGPLCDPIIPIQDDLNNMFNMAAETILRAIPKTLADNSLFTEETWKNASISEVIRTRLGSGQNIANLVAQLPTARFSDQLIPFAGLMRDWSRDTDGIQPALYGGGPVENTFRASLQKKNQAMMQIKPAFSEMQYFVRDVSQNGIRIWAETGIGAEKVAMGPRAALAGTHTVDPSKLSMEGWHVEASESVPMSFSEKADRIAAIVQENPQLAASLSMMHPMNTREMQSYFGIDEFYNQGENEENYCLEVIRQLLEQQPIEAPDPMTGQIVRQPSIQPREFEEGNHQAFVDIVRAWALTAGQRARAENPEGYENVILWGQAHEQMAMAAQMAAAAPTGPNGPGPGGPPPPSPPESKPFDEVTTNPFEEEQPILAA